MGKGFVPPRYRRLPDRAYHSGLKLWKIFVSRSISRTNSETGRRKTFFANPDRGAERSFREAKKSINILFIGSLCGESEKNGGIPFELNFIFYTFKTGLIVAWNLLTDLA